MPIFAINYYRTTMNLKNDSLNLYDIYRDRKSEVTILEDIIPTSIIDRMPSNTKKVIWKNRKRPTTALSINGLHAAYHISLLLAD